MFFQRNDLKRAVCLILCLLLLGSLSSAVLADNAPQEDEEEPAAEEFNYTPIKFGEYDRFSVLDAEELDARIQDFMKEKNLNDRLFAISYCYIATGETWTRNGDSFLDGCSLYKIALNMVLSNREHEGLLTQDTKLHSYKLGYIEQRSLQNSDNKVSEAVLPDVGGIQGLRKTQAELAGIPEEALPADYYRTVEVSPNMMNGLLKELYINCEQYPHVIENMLLANPGHYFRLNLGDTVDIAQKYGGRPEYLHTAAIIYTPYPVLLTVMTYNAARAEKVLGACAELIVDYTAGLDERLEQALAAEEAENARLEAEAEARRIAEQEAEAKAEAARLLTQLASRFFGR